MKQFTYTITDEIGIHARPAGLLAKEAKECLSEVTIEKGGKSAGVTKIMAVMSMGIKCGDSVTVSVEGIDEDVACDRMKEFFEKNL